MKLNSPLPQTLPKECDKAAKIFKSFVDSGNNGLDGVIPRTVLENARGFAIFSVFKAGFLFSARAGSGVVIARLDDGTWSAPSAIGLAGVGVGGQAGAEMTDFLIVLNSRSHIRSFMAAGSLTLGGNMSLAVGPLGRNGEASGALNTSGKVAAMYSYSKTRGLFGGVSVEGSVIVERQDANAQAYKSDVSVKVLLSGSVDPPEFAMGLIHTLDACTGMPGNRHWVKDDHSAPGTPIDGGYAFGGIASSGTEGPASLKKSRKNSNAFPPASWGRKKSSGSYFNTDAPTQGNTITGSDRSSVSGAGRPSWDDAPRADSTQNFGTRFESDFVPDAPNSTPRPQLGSTLSPNSPMLGRGSLSHTSSKNTSLDLSRFNPKPIMHSRSASAAAYPSYDSYDSNPFAPSIDEDEGDLYGSSTDKGHKPSLRIAAKAELTRPLHPGEGVARAIALFDFKGQQGGDLSFNKGDVITITEKSDTTDTWWKGKAGGRVGIFPANFVEVV
ncbi:hypothetical protein HETIRDRAFT_38024 [Heterobasidion irregulare TC 32-1]|uniref:SH3 domain-containing protein n=1 Tax=Heterobasidion irregulare (strain TC 32-1) TaxID=747525 RepID=W4JQJ6_HETIT|nr:uncharacterized protein HETIRDRAFT_38024 [Heterobasidion irregulare TC 32-1]ETW75827.1 hypothetical protein HETIRDRAFT_38024 [Heterobasidion irregulare TC 32-1]